jgi:rhamnogalacturonan endolyase
MKRSIVPARALKIFSGALAFAAIGVACSSDSEDGGGGDGGSGGTVSTGGTTSGAAGAAGATTGGTAGNTSGGTSSGGASGGGGSGAGGSSAGGSSAGESGTGGASAGNAGAGGTSSGAAGGGTGGAAGNGGGSGGSGATGGSGGATNSACGVNPALGTGRIQMENLCRGVVAVRSGSDNFVSWRLMGYEAQDTGFNVYRSGSKVTAAPITNSTNYVDTGAPANATYTVRAVAGGVEQGDSANSRTSAAPASTWAQNYLNIPLMTPASYRPGDTQPGDLDGDGQYELVVKEENTPRDPSQDGVTGQAKFAAYKLDGTFMWRVDLGINIRESEHTTQFLVYDLDGDGSAELTVKTAPGTRDGTGAFLRTGPAASDNDSADYRNSAGKILGGGPEYLTVFSGRTGAELATIAYHAPYSSGSFGDNTGNRSDRYNATAAFLDTTGRPSAVMQRGYYARMTFGAYNYRGGQLSLLWSFDSSAQGNSAYAGKGVHSVMAADGNGDGRQEILPGGATIGPDGRGLCTVSFYAHGDAIHVGDLVPSRPGLELFQITEGTGVPGYYVRDVSTCQVLWQGPNSTAEGPARGAAGDISPNNPGAEVWGSGFGLSSASAGTNVGSAPSAANFLLWWDGDESRELLNGTTVSQYDGAGQGFTATGCSSINGSKSVPNLSADLFGDWREEVVFTCGNALRIYTTTQPTTRRIYTLMHDPQYRMNVTAESATYNQPPHTSFHIGSGMAAPPRPDILVR